MNDNLIRILLVDDHPLVRDGLRARLSGRQNWAVVGEAEMADEALRLVRELSPHLVIIDLSLKSGSGMELIKQIATSTNPPRMLVCTMHDENLYAHRAIQAGALGFLHKQQASEFLIQAIERVLLGRIFVSEDVLQQMLARVVRTGEEAAKSPVEQLTDRELQVFEAIGQGMTINQIASTLFLSIKTVETYRDRTKRKLNVRTSAELMRYAIRWVSEHAQG